MLHVKCKCKHPFCAADTRLIISKQQETLERVRATERWLANMERTITKSFSDLKQLLQQEVKRTFVIKKSEYEVRTTKRIMIIMSIEMYI